MGVLPGHKRSSLENQLSFTSLYPQGHKRVFNYKASGKPSEQTFHGVFHFSVEELLGYIADGLLSGHLTSPAASCYTLM